MKSVVAKETAVRLGAGVVIGASMLLPGVSGGTMAIILGIYDRLVAAVSGLSRTPGRSLPLLGTVALGGLAGMACFAGPLLALVQAYPQPALYFFLGAVLGSVPLLLRKARLRRLTAEVPLYALAGFFTALLVSALPTSLLRGEGGWLPLFAAGLMLSAALVLPGISASYMLLVLGLYEPFLTALGERRLGFLAVLGAGTLLGVLATTRLLEKAMDRHPQPTYLMITGFVIAALREVYPGLPQGWGVIWCGCTLAAGFLGVSLLARKSAR